MVSLVGEERKSYAVLFVDDEENILRSIRRAVIDEEYNTYFAGSGAEALKIMEENEINVIVTDMRMPGMDGLQLLKIIKEKYPMVVKIVLSGFTQLSQVLATVNQADIFNFIAKPWDMESELKYVINKAIEYYRLQEVEIQLRDKLAKRNDAYQTILKKMEISSGLRGKQLQQIKKISAFLVQAIDKNSNNESRFLATLLAEYAERLPGATDRFSLEQILGDLRLLVTQRPYYSRAAVQVKESVQGNMQGSASSIYFAVSCLLNLIQQNSDIKELYIYIVTKEQGDKVVLTFSVFFLDVADCYQSALPQCSYQLLENIFSEIMDAKFVTLHKSDRRIMQLEFLLEKA